MHGASAGLAMALSGVFQATWTFCGQARLCQRSWHGRHRLAVSGYAELTARD